MINLKKEPIYFPIEKPVYEVGPGLKIFGADCGSAEFDNKVFQIAEDFFDFRKNKLQARAENFSKYIVSDFLSPDVFNAVCDFIMVKLKLDYPNYFLHDRESKIFKALHTQDEIHYDINYDLKKFISVQQVDPAPIDLLDALMLQVPEDISILQRKPDKQDYLAYLNLCSPSHWSAQDKIGKSFFQVHVPVASADKLLKASTNFVESMINRGPFVRFVWSFVTDTRLNHHPEAPPGWDEKTWKGRSFDISKESPFYFRVERQTVWGFPKIESSLFTIRLSFMTGKSIKNNPHQAKMLIGALQSMTPESRVYKGVDKCFDDLIHYLSS